MRGWALGAIAGLALAGCGGGDGGGADQTRVRTTGSGTIIAERTDPARGLRFEIQTSIESRNHSDLLVHLEPKAPAATRRAVLGKDVAFTCQIPADPIRYLPQRWDPGKRTVRTALQPARPVRVADKAKTCMLWLGAQSSLPGTEDFRGKPFSQVRLR